MPSAAMTISASALASVGERHPGLVAVLREAAAPVPGVDGAGWQGIRQHRNEVGAVHSECRVPARGVRHLNRGNGRSVVAEIARIVTNTRAPFLHCRFQPNPLQVAYAVGREEHAGPDLPERRSLLVDRHLKATCDQRIGGEQATDPASDDDDTRPEAHHINSLWRAGRSMYHHTG
jgi:hypothetical protein